MSRECKSGFVETYVRYTEPHGAPESFHWWSAVSLIACALGRRVWLDQWAYLLYPNVYVLLVSPSGLCHRSTVVDMAFGVFQQALPGWRYKLFAQKGTPEGLIDAAQESQSVYGKAGGSELIVKVGEFATLFGRVKKDSSLLHVITDWYGCPPGLWGQKTRGGGMMFVDRPCLNMLAGSSPSWLRESLPRDSLYGGFASRFTFVYAGRPKHTKSILEVRDEVVGRKAEFDDMRLALVHDLVTISKIRGEFSMAADAVEWYNTWCLKHDPCEAPDELTGYAARKPHTLLKLSMIMSAQANSSKTIRIQHLEAADRALAGVEGHLVHIVEAIHMDEPARKLWLVKRRIGGMSKKGKRTTKSRLLRALSGNVSGNELKQILADLTESGEIKIVDNQYVLTGGESNGDHDTHD